jgi:hypothetical protein
VPRFAPILEVSLRYQSGDRDPDAGDHRQPGVAGIGRILGEVSLNSTAAVSTPGAPRAMVLPIHERKGGKTMAVVFTRPNHLPLPEVA